jgi:hypothetical protein
MNNLQQRAELVVGNFANPARHAQVSVSPCARLTAHGLSPS